MFEDIEWNYTNQYSAFYWMIISWILFAITGMVGFTPMVQMVTFFTTLTIINVSMDIYFHLKRRRNGTN